MSSSTFKYTSGLGNTAAYQVSGKPFISASIDVPAQNGVPLEITFPNVTRSITVRNDSAVVIRVGFSANGITGSAASNYVSLANGISFQEDLKVESIFLISEAVDAPTRGECTIIAGLTGIPGGSIQNNWSGSAGIG